MNIYKYNTDCRWTGYYCNNTVRYYMTNIISKELITGICLYSNEDICMMSILENGKNHNINGPAKIFKNGKLDYFINNIKIGTNLSNKEFEQKIKEQVFK